MKANLSLAAAIAVLAMGATARAETLPLLTFETDEFAGDGEASTPLGGANGTGFGVTQGTQAFQVRNVPSSGSGAFYFITTVSGSDTGEPLANFQVFQQVVSALQSGRTATLSYDFSYDFTNVSSGGYFQPGVVLNSAGGGFSAQWFGALLRGDVQPGPAAEVFPSLNAGATAAGVTMTVLDPLNYSTNDLVGTVRVNIPVGLSGSGKPLLIGPDATPANSYYAIEMHMQGGYGGTADFAFDNVVFNLPSVAQPGDFNEDTLLNAADVELLLHQPNGPVSGNAKYDVNGDNQIITAPKAAGSDTDYWVITLAGTRYGDTNFDKKVDFNDLVTLAQHYNKPGTWSDGSFDGDGTVAFADLVLLAQNYGFVSPSILAELAAIDSDFAHDLVLAQALVPEPTALAALGVASVFLRRSRRRA